LDYKNTVKSLPICIHFDTQYQHWTDGGTDVDKSNVSIPRQLADVLTCISMYATLVTFAKSAVHFFQNLNVLGSIP